MFHIGVHPDPSLKQLFERCKAVLVGMGDNKITKMVEGQPAFTMINISEGIYPSLEKPITTFGSTMFLIASDSLDEQTAITIMKALDNNQQSLRNAHTALNDFTVTKVPKRTSGVQHHPGAATYLSTKDD